MHFHNFQVRFLLEAGADQEHKTDEMHTALMEASMDGHVEVARLLLDSGAQVNMPADSFESPLTLAACGGHVELAMLLLERGANIEEVNDEGYTPLMEAAREGHEEMVALLLSQGADINAQTEETQETALTLACCGGFLDVADFLIKAGADIELGASTPLMEAAQEGHLELVKYLLEARADVNAQTGTVNILFQKLILRRPFPGIFLYQFDFLIFFVSLQFPIFFTPNSKVIFDQRISMELLS